MENSIRVLKPDAFPRLLQEINDPPEKLFVQGTLPDDDTNKFLCVVGNRAYTPYGKEACEKLIAGLRGYPIVIVSGLALGIDGIAHRSALAAGLITIAVPGSGLHPSVLYPATHRGLAEKILESGGALISEFEDTFRATKWGFPQRNRLMAGLSHAVLVIEAQEKSGTLITARLAVEYNRDVGVVPGSIFAKGSAAPHLFLRLGATPITTSNDLLMFLGFDTETEQSHAREQSFRDCSPDEQKVLALLTTPLSHDELIRVLDLPIAAANALLSGMEIKGLIIERFRLFERSA